ncbi:MAG: hypothetical protein M1820_003422 [Bogoriella megaspora]|nr:MAG: hypothetical protein M1820_003422 [Bogoriella megaspora]
MAMFDYKGRLLPFDESKEVSETFWSIVMEAFKYSHDHTASIPAHESLWSFFKKKVEDQFLDSPQEEARRKRQNLLKMSEMWGAFIGGTIQTQSLKFFWLEECIEGENPFCAETYHKILNYIAEPAIKRDIVRYSHKVVQITTSESLDAPKISVRIADGKSHDFDEVVVTTPLGWLKQNTSMFKPELPPRIVKAIASIGYGNLDKVYFTFPTAFWDTPNQSESNGGIEDHSTNPLRNAPNTTATTAPLHQFRSNANAASHFAGFMQWTSPHYAPSNPEHWNQEGMNLAALPPSCAHPTLLFYVFGPCALHISAIVRETQPSQLTKVLFDYFEPYISRLPNYKGDGTECQPLEALATAWANDELAGWGSYSNFPVGLEEGDKDIEVMREGVPERGIWLAGEHTAPFVALGTVTGAYWSGEGLAKRIARVYGMHGGDETKQTATTD